VDVRVDPTEVTLDPLSERWLAEQGTFTARKNVELLREFAARPAQPDARRRIVLRFLRSPVEIRGEGRVEAIDVSRNEIVQADDGTLRPGPAGDEPERIECGLVLRSVGYRAVPLPGVPFDERSYILPNDRGRVLAPDGEPLPGVYAVGWIKRGPTGILGTNKRDAEETVARLAEDLSAGALPAAQSGGHEDIAALLADRQPDLVTVEGWRAIEADELRRGEEQQRPRVKLSSREELLAAARAGG
jgi:ferredoxin--NADP+ reductase